MSDQVRRVAVISYHSSPLSEPGSGDAGGMTVYVREMAAALARRGVQTDILTRATSDIPRVVEIAPGIRAVAIEAGPRAPVAKEMLPGYLDDFVAGTRAFVAGQRIRYDIVHSHYWQSGVAAVDLARGWGVPLVHSHHTLGRVKNRYLAPGDAPEPESRLTGESRVIEAADVLIASTDEEWQQLACLYGAPHDRLKTIHPGVDHANFRLRDKDSARRSLGLGDERILLCVARIQPLKGIELAIRSLEELLPAVDEGVKLVIVGGASGPGGLDEETRLAALATELGVADKVWFAGPQPHEMLPAFYAAADVVLVCSHSESFGLTALEAHACGVPVVGTAVGGLSFVVRDGESGWLVDSREPHIFAGRLKTILSDDALWRRFSTAAELSARQLSWSRAADSLLDLYTCLAQERYPEACTC